MHGKGYWIKGGMILDVSNTTHIARVIATPEKFGLTTKEINVIYEKYGEDIRSEGNAREEIIKKVSEKGWVRVRYYLTKGEYWSIQFDTYANAEFTSRNFVEWAVLDSGVMNRSDTLYLLGYKDGYAKKYDFHTGGAKRFLEERKLKGQPLHLLTCIEERIEGFLDAMCK